MTLKTPSGLDSLRLHQHQKDAVRVTIDYMRAWAPSALRAALVQMPTGAGKTGIVAVLSRMCPGINRTLILAPRTAVRDQLIREVAGNFFSKIGITPKPRTVQALEPSLASSPEPWVAVATVQQLDSWRRTKPALYSSLRSMLDLVVMDEGHYEPALSWSKTIRDLARPTLLLTATPYRNDLKTFRIEQGAVSTLRFDKAVEQGVIRDVEVIQREKFTDPTEFAQDVLAAFHKYVPVRDRQNSRIIIRCDDSKEIRALCHAFEKLGASALGIHEAFSSDGKRNLTRVVPRPDAVAFTIWIHQFKLLEGVDDPTFRMVAIYGAPVNVRALVQQVGRVIRNPDLSRGSKAFLLDHTTGHLSAMWEQYRRFDRTVDSAQLSTSLADRVRESISAGFCGLEYFDRRFREPFSFSAVEADPLNAFRVPLETNVLRASGASAQGISDWLEQYFAESDCAFRRYDIGANRLLFAYVKASNSRLLEDTYFLEPRLGLMIATVSGDLVSFYDSGGMVPVNSDDANVQGAPHQSQLGRLIQDGKRARVAEISTRNGSVARGAIRSRSYSAASLAEVSPNVDDFQYVVTAMSGYSAEPNHSNPIRRYVGFTRGRVSEPGKTATLSNYLSWTDEILSRTKSTKHKPNALVLRFSRELESPPPDTDPTNILIDFTHASELFKRVAPGPNAGDLLDVADSCLDCTAAANQPGRAKCTLEANNASYDIEVEYDPTRRRYFLSSKPFDEDYKQSDGSEGLISWLNRNQSFNVVPKSKNSLYVHGSFYESGIPIGARFSEDKLPVIKILEAIPKLRKISSEKGLACLPKDAGWAKASLFGEIDAIATKKSLLSGFVRNPTVLVCDDMSRETCDFYLCDENRVVMIHAKAAGKPKPLSASSLQEVTAQAVKNAGRINLLNKRKPDNLMNVWPKPWSSTKTTKGKVKSRIRIGTKSNLENWRQIDELIGSPNTNREVWIVLGSILNKDALIKELKKADPAPQALQLTHLLLSCLATVSAAGARLRIFCG